MSRWQLTPEAENDLFEIWAYVARDNRDAANDVEEAIIWPAIYFPNHPTPVEPAVI
jgi:hypothetical protein